MSAKSILINQIQQLSGVERINHLLISPESNDFMVVEIYFDPESVVDRLTPEEVQRRNYNANVKRGLINDKTSFYDFICKLDEEVTELYQSANNDNSTFDASELADISHVCDSIAHHYGIDLQAEKEAKMLVNEKRID